MGITGGAETDEAVAACDNSNGAFVYTHYSRAGYGIRERSMRGAEITV